MTLMPQKWGELKIKAKGAGQVRLDRGKEVAKPDYYKVSYASGKTWRFEITTEMTADFTCVFLPCHIPKG